MERSIDLKRVILTSSSKELNDYLIKGGDIDHLIEEDELEPPNNTMLLYALKKGKKNLAKELIEKGANIHSVNNYGMDALIASTIIGSLDLVSLLLEKGAKVNSQQYGGFSSLHIAAKGKLSLLEVLLAHPKIDINLQSDKGFSSLHIAAKGNFPNEFKLLLEKGASTKLKTIEGMTAFDYAKQEKHYQIIEIFKGEVVPGK